MKKISILFTAIVTLLFYLLTPIHGYAATYSPTNSIIEVTSTAQGDYTYITVLTKEIPIESSSSARGVRQSISGEKTVYVTDSSGNTLWSLTVSAAFNYNGTTATCTGCSHRTSTSSNWIITNSSSYFSGNSATATATAIKKILGITVSSNSASVTIQCDANGNLS